MPDISQIVPLSAILGVTTDCLLRVGGDKKADRENLYAEVQKINKGIENVYSRNDNAYYECYALYEEHIKKYPLDYEIKLLYAAVHHYLKALAIKARFVRFYLSIDTLAVQLYTSLLPRRIRDFHPLERAHGAQT